VARRSAVIASLAAVCILSAATASSYVASGVPEAITDNETVYIIADATGAPRTTVVVDWLQVEGSGRFTIADPAPGIGAIESLTDGFAPERAGDDVIATVDVDGNGDFFYRAETDAELPLEVEMVYFLDGQETAPADLAGKSGRLRIEITLTNLLEREDTVTYVGSDGLERTSEVTYTVPLLCIPQFEIDGTRMTAIEAPASAQLAIAGSTLTYALPMVPSPESTAFLEMDARDIELAPLIISAFPKLPASPDFSVADDLLELRDGLSDLRRLSEGQLQVLDGITGGMSEMDLSGAAGAADGIAALTSGLGELGDGADGLAQLTAGQYLYLDGVIAGIDASRFESLGQLQAAIGQMRAAASQLATGTAGLVQLLDGQIALAEGIRASNAGLLAQADGFVASYSADATLAPAAADFQTLAEGLGAQQHLLDVLLDGGDPDGSGPAPAMPGLRTTRSSLHGIADGVAALADGLEQIESQSAALGAVPDAFLQLRQALVVLRDGGTVSGQALPGLGATRDGLTGVANGLSRAEAGLAGSAAELARLAELPVMMAELADTLDALARGGAVRGQHLPGLTTTSGALQQITSNLGWGVDDMREGEALTEAMSAAADAYTSFLGLPEGADGHLSFLYKLDGVKTTD
jgi:putative membrane protein